MKVRADEHVSIQIVRALRNMAVSDKCELSHVSESGDRGAQDEHWITKFAKYEDGYAILSADTDFFKKPHQVVAVDRTGLRVIHLPHNWANARCALQAAHILMWWGRIEALLASCNPRECWRVPWNISEVGDLKKQRVDYADQARKHKKALRRTARQSHQR